MNGEFEEDSDDGYINKNSLPMGDITEDTVTAVLLGSKDFLSFGYQIASGMVSVCQVHVSLSLSGSNWGHIPPQNVVPDCSNYCQRFTELCVSTTLGVFDLVGCHPQRFSL